LLSRSRIQKWRKERGAEPKEGKGAEPEEGEDDRGRKEWRDKYQGCTLTLSLIPIDAVESVVQ
jgi:hypothetical protein